MDMKMHTLEISDNVRVRGFIQKEVVLEVDFQMSGYIHEIRVYSEYFEAFVPVSETWLENNLPVSLETIRDAVSAEINSLCMPKQKEFNNDDPGAA